MADPVLTAVPSSSFNALKDLIPTDSADIVVRDLLGPTFGEAILAKIPGIDPGSIADVSSATELLRAIFGVYNGAVLLFGAVILTFVAIIGLWKTANDGELFGKGWNTQFTIARMLMGAVFIAPLPNGFSTIQNFTMYVALWGSGIGNQVNNALADHHLKQLYIHLADQTPTVQSIREDSIAILKMHVCAHYINDTYKGQGAALKLTTTPGPKDAMEVAYYETGSFEKSNTPICGRVIIDPDDSKAMWESLNIPVNDPGGMGGLVIVPDPRLPELTGNRTGYFTTQTGKPLNRETRLRILELTEQINKEMRDIRKIMAVDPTNGLAAASGPLSTIAKTLVTSYRSGLIQHNDDGSIKSAGVDASTLRIPTIGQMAILNKYIDSLNLLQQKQVDLKVKALVADASPNGNFFKHADRVFKMGGWGGAGATYRTMFELSSISTDAAKKPHFHFENPYRQSLAAGHPSAGGLGQNLETLYRTIDVGTRSTDAVPSVARGTAPTSGGATMVIEKPTLTLDSFQQLMETKNFDTAFNILLGSGNTKWNSNIRQTILRGLTLDGKGDPMMQIKSLGDSMALTAEAIITIEWTARTVIGIGRGIAKGGEVASNNIALGVFAGIPAVGASALSETVSYIMEEVWLVLRTMVVMLMALSYGFSTWIPSIPYVAHLFAVLGFFFAVIMTSVTMPLWSAMHLTPARNDSFIGSETQGYLLILALFTRPVLSMVGLAFSYAIAQPVVGLINKTFLPFMLGNEVAAGSVSFFFLTVFTLILYFSILQGVLTWIFVLPQALPDQVLRILSAGIGDLGESKAISTAEAGHAAGRLASDSLAKISDGVKGRIVAKDEAAKKEAKDAKKRLENAIAAGRPGLGPSQ